MLKRSDNTAQEARMVGRSKRQWLGNALSRIAFAIVIGLGAGLTGPFGTYLTMSEVFRLAYWQAVMIVGFGLWWALEALIEKTAAPQNYAVKRALIIPPFAGLNSAYIWGLNSALGNALGFQIPVGWSDLLISHLVLSFFVVLPAILLVRAGNDKAEAQGGSDAISFLTQKMPQRLRGSLPYALSAEGHYVRVFTHGGDDLIQMRFEDALHAVAGIEGLQTHRSWWIALKEIEEVLPVGSAFEAKLRNGATIPVARRKRAMLVSALDRALG